MIFTYNPSPGDAPDLPYSGDMEYLMHLQDQLAMSGDEFLKSRGITPVPVSESYDKPKLVRDHSQLDEGSSSGMDCLGVQH